ncbi:hypothetical protein [Aeromonas enteropelogenes]|uniref:hypothetical protein n=1 Tax=Aeromonas enteropelogenes TaxID=29489 RepID=UPI003F748A9D
MTVVNFRAGPIRSVPYFARLFAFILASQPYRVMFFLLAILRGDAGWIGDMVD